MKVSYNWLKELVDFEYSHSELAGILTMLGLEVEGIEDFGEKYKNFKISEVIKAEKIPNADKLTLCKVNDGVISRDVVCGASNVAAGQKVVLGLPGAVVPKGGFRIEEMKIRSVLSHGMLCSQAELELGDDHSGIWVLNPDATVGINVSDYLGINDIILDVSLTPNRPDCLSHIGIAREIVAFNNSQFIIHTPQLPLERGGKKTEVRRQQLAVKSNLEADLTPTLSKGEGDNVVKVIIEDAEKCPRYTARVIKNAKIGESPDWLKYRLHLLGLRPINAVVDVTNYVLMETGQPLHAFDLTQISGNKIIVKTASDGEKFTTLDGKERTLDSEMLMICDGSRPVAIGGVMGGENSEIANETKDILLESAYFNPSSIRRTSKKLGITSESSYRFERGADIENVIYASNRAAHLISEFTGGIVSDVLVDEFPGRKVITYPQTPSHEGEKTRSITPSREGGKEVWLRFERTDKMIGKVLSNDIIKVLCEALNFRIIEENDEGVLLKVPSYRVDISSEIDVIEEIARLYNYDNIDPDYSSSINFLGENVPERLAMPEIRNKLRTILVTSGFTEIITQNQSDPKIAKVFPYKLIGIANPLGEELSAMRQSLVPSMLKTIEHNIRQDTKNLRLFEIGKTFHFVDYKDSFIVNHSEKDEIIIAITGSLQPMHWDNKGSSADFFSIKGIFETVFKDYLKIDYLKSQSLTQHNYNEQFFTKNRLALIYNFQQIGILGEVSKDTLKKFDIGQPVMLLVMDLKDIYKLSKVQPKYKQVSPYPAVSRDLAFITDEDIIYENMKDEIMSNGGELLKSVEIFDVYQDKSVGTGKKSMAYSLVYSSAERTLTDEEVDNSINIIITSVEKKFNASLRK